MAGSVVVGRGPRGRRCAPVGEALVIAPPDSHHLQNDGVKVAGIELSRTLGTRRIPLAASTTHRVRPGSIASGRVCLLTPSTRNPAVDRRPHQLQQLPASAREGERHRSPSSGQPREMPPAHPSVVRSGGRPDQPSSSCPYPSPGANAGSAGDWASQSGTYALAPQGGAEQLVVVVDQGDEVGGGMFPPDQQTG